MRLGLLFALLITPASAAELTLDFQLRWAGAPLTVPSQEFATAHGQMMRLTRVAGVVSGVALARADGGVLRLDGQYGFVDAGAGRLAVALRNVPAGDYAGVEFQFGLPPAINHADPGQWPSGHPLNPLTNHLHWNWQGGYVFLALEGRWRDNASTSAGDERGFLYHLAGDDRVMRSRFVAPFRVDGDTTIHLAFELGKVLTAQRLATNDGSDSTHSGSDDSVAARLVNGVQRSFFWLEATRTAVAKPTTPAEKVAAAGKLDATSATPLPFHVPAGFPQPNLPDDNPLTVEGVALGRALFYDRRLSRGGAQSCASCHLASRAFSDHVAFSRGADGTSGTRNAMPLFNLAWSSSFAWDGSKPKVRDQALAAMVNPKEMHADPAQVTAVLARDPAIMEKFRAAFGTPDVTASRVTLALEQYLLTILSADAKFDRAMRGEAKLSDEEKEGFALFMTEFDPARGRRGADCFHCHGGPLFTDYDFKNNGLDAKAGNDTRAAVTRRPEDTGKFKTPSLRNVAVTGPYMHDGRFTTLEDVIAHYDHGVIRSRTLDPNLAKHPDDGLKLTSADQRALLAFLRTLTDDEWKSMAN
jgi:cytochrome c peroxidase